MRTIAAAAGGCSTLLQNNSNATSTGNSFTVANNVSRTYGAIKFTAANSGTVCRIDLPLFKSGSPAMQVRASIWSHNAGADEPNAILAGTVSSWVAATGFPASDPMADTNTWVRFENASFAVTASSTYWVVVETDAQDAGNFFLWALYGASSSSRQMTDQSGTAPWSLETSRTGAAILYGN